MDFLPLVSIIIPVYNGANYMKEAIDSALNQTYANTEVLVINDGSNDNGDTEKIAKSYGARIRYFHKENGGVSSALNIGIQNMTGEYFSWLSHDDVYTPDKIEKQVIALMKHDQNKSVAICQTDLIDTNSNPLINHNQRFGKGVLCWEDAVMFITRYGANGCAFLIPRNVFQTVGLFDENLRYCQDILMWWNIFLNKYSLVFVDSVGVHSRVHSQQVTHTRADLYKHDAKYIGYFIPRKLGEMSTKENNCLFVYAKNEAIRGNRNNTEKCITISKDKALFSCIQKLILRFFEIVGFFRPIVRKLYYRIFKKV